MRFLAGQRYVSETEPELGLGRVVDIEGRSVRIDFPGSGEVRQYAADAAPLCRAAFRPGDSLRTADGSVLVVESVREKDGLFVYESAGRAVSETELSDSIRFVHPEERLLGGHADESRSFDLRLQTWQHLRRIRNSPARGFAGARIDLIPHQLYVAQEVASRTRARAMLSDEVGLGKTIEAGLILKRLELQGRVRRVLVLVPSSLVHQWWVELLRRFNLSFAVYDEERWLALSTMDAEANPFHADQHVLCALDWAASLPLRAAQAAGAGWDLVIVDEAQHVHWRRSGPDANYRLVEALAHATPGLLLLTATPEQFGEESHFGRLRLLDPERYADFELFLKEAQRFSEVSRAAASLAGEGNPTAKERQLLRAFLGAGPAAAMLRGRSPLTDSTREELLRELLDRHGPGRVLFRNTRAAIRGFPPRAPHPIPLTAKGSEFGEILAMEHRMWSVEAPPSAKEWIALDYAADPRVEWLATELRKHPDRKLLVLCHARGQVQAVAEGLRKRIHVSMALFHEDIPLVQRDRQAAWFSEPDGARVLLCSEIGGEGRNFQFAHGLVLFDLPLDPELLEQRIGRLDRIGRSEPVHLYIPYVLGTWQESLFRWFHEGLDAFSRIIADGNELRELFAEDLAAVCGAPKIPVKRLQALIDRTRAEHDRLLEQAREGRDQLLELHSYRAGPADACLQAIRSWDQDPEFRNYVLDLLDQLGVHVEELDRTRLRMEPSHLFAEAFADMPKEGATMTLSRAEALAREDLGFLTWDHPVIMGGIELLLRSEQGNCAVAVFEGPLDAQYCLEAVYVLEAVAPPHLEIDRFLPPTPVRVLVDDSLRDQSVAHPDASWQARLRDARSLRVQDHREHWRDVVRSMMVAAESRAEAAALQVRTDALVALRRETESAAARLEHLAERNPHTGPDALSELNIRAEQIAERVRSSELRLDALRLVLAQPPGGR